MDALTQLREQVTKRLNDKADGFINNMVKNNWTTITHTTASCAPAFGWSVEDYNDMPRVANILREKGLTVTSSVNHGVTDWKISL